MPRMFERAQLPGRVIDLIRTLPVHDPRFETCCRNVSRYVAVEVIEVC